MIPSRHPTIREKRHRLPRDCYRGEVTVAFTACVEDGHPLFTDARVVEAFRERLSEYPFTGAVGIDLASVMTDAASL